MSERSAKWALGLLVVLYLTLGVAYSVVNPIFESPDEAMNYANIRLFVEERRLPVLEPGEPTKAHHPPLYYGLGALLTAWVPNENLQLIVDRVNPFWAYQSWESGNDNKSLYLHDPQLEAFPYRDVALGVHLLRWYSLLANVATIICVYLTAREIIGPERRGAVIGATALVALNPMFIFISGSVHDDALANLVAAATLYVTTRCLLHGLTGERVVALGALVGLGILTKLTCLLVLPTVALALVCRPLAEEGRAGWRQVLRAGVVVAGLALLVGGWWFVRNIVLYGEPTSMVRQTEVWGVRENAPDLAAAVSELRFLHDSMWGVFGYGQIPLPAVVYWATRLLGLAALGGLILFWIRRRAGKADWECSPSVLLVLVTAPLVALAANFARMTVSATADFGRYLFVTLAVLAPLFSIGLSEWMLPRQWAGLVVSLLMLTLAIYAVAGVLAPAYAPPIRYESPDEVAPQHPVAVTYPGVARLLGYDVSPMPVYPGDVLRVTIYWQVLGEVDQDYAMFLQVFGREGVKIGERDTHPGLGRYPTGRWQANEVIADEVPVTLEAGAVAPSALRLDLGLYLPGGPRLTTDEGWDTISMGPVRLAAREVASPEGVSLSYQLGGGIRLVAWRRGWEDPVRRGDEIEFTLYWACEDTPGRPLNLFVHLVDAGMSPLAQGDGPPLGGDYPTDLWVAGDLIADERVVSLPGSIEPGQYELIVGMYDLESGVREPVLDESGARLVADAVPLATVEVSR